MGTAIALAALAGCVLLLLPIPVVVALRWDDAREGKWSLSVRIWGGAIVRLPDTRRPARTDSSTDRDAALPPWLGKLVEWTAGQWRKLRHGKRGGAPNRRDPIALVKRILDTVLVRPTRGLRLEVGGFDPALLAASHGLFLSVRPLLPGRGEAFHVVPDWTAYRPRVRLVWSWRASIARIAGGIVAAFASGRSRSSHPETVTEEGIPRAG